MEDKEFYKQLLGVVEPWKVIDVKLDLEKERVDIFIKYEDKTCKCPICKKECKIYDFLEERIWRHLDSCQMKTYIHCKQPRSTCKGDGVKTITPSWAEPNSRFTLIFEIFAIKFLQEVKCQKRAAKLMRVTENELSYIKRKAVARGLSRRKIEPQKTLCIDEKSIENGHNYASILYDLTQACVIDLCKGRTKISVRNLVKQTFSQEQREVVECFTMDMWKAFISVVNDMFPNCEIVHDKFHIMAYLNKAVDKTRKKEHKKLLKEDNKSLVKSKYLFLKNENNMTDKQKNMFSKLKNANFETSKVWALKETFKAFFNLKTVDEADKFFKDWCHEVDILKNTFLLNVKETLVKHYDNIRTYIKHRKTNALAESLNAKIQEIKTIARGFKGFENFRVNVLFYLGKLNMLPQTFK
jgi:transposase